MLIDIKRLFWKDCQIGRFEYLKLVCGLVFIPLIMLFLLIATPPESYIYYFVLGFLVVSFLFYLVVSYAAVFGRLNNIFNKKSIVITLLVGYIILGIITLLHIIFDIILLVIPGKRQSDNIFSTKFFSAILILFVGFVISFNISGVNRFVVSESMADTLQIHDRFFVNIFARDYKRGDIVVYKPENNGGVVFVKRVVALPGEKVDIITNKDGATYVYINNIRLDEPYVKDKFNYSEVSPENTHYLHMVVPDNSYYVLGDNRGNSLDSRNHGAVRKEVLKGVVTHIYFPLNRIKSFN